MERNKRIGVDVGGSHVSASLFDMSHSRKQSLDFLRKDINAFDNAYNILEAIGNCIKELQSEKMAIDSVGIAFPGPFDYENGVSAIVNVGGKFKQTFGLHIRQALKDLTGLTNTPFVFSNDAHCFAVGAYHRYHLRSKRTVFLTLGTGFGSAYMENGVLLPQHPSLPAMESFYNESFLNAKADDYF